MADKSRRNFIIGMASLGALAAAGWGVAGWSFSRLSGTKVTQATSAFGEGLR